MELELRAGAKLCKMPSDKRIGCTATGMLFGWNGIEVDADDVAPPSGAIIESPAAFASTDGDDRFDRCCCCGTMFRSEDTEC